MVLLTTTRFNNLTWEENERWRENNSYNGCVYGLMKPIAVSIPINSFLIVLEMNNDENKIMGFGLIQNVAQPKENISIYSNPNYCLVVYNSRYRIDRKELTEQQEIYIKILEILVFKGATHLKRGQGITLIPKKILKRGLIDLKKELVNILITKYNNLSKII